MDFGQFLGRSKTPIYQAPPVHPCRYDDIRMTAHSIAADYFSIKLDESDLLLRRPPGEIANPVSVASDDYVNCKPPFTSIFMNSYTKSRSAVNSPIETIGDNPDFMSEIVELINLKKYTKLISYTKILNLKRPKVILLPYIGYLASICAQSRDDELYFAKIIEKSSISPEDYCQFIHLLDEIRFIETNPNFTPTLIQLLKFPIKDLNNVMSGGYRITPGFYQNIPNFNENSTLRLMALSEIKERAEHSLPQLGKVTIMPENENIDQEKE